MQQFCNCFSSVICNELSFVVAIPTDFDGKTANKNVIFVRMFRILQYNLPANFVTTQNNILKNMKKTELDALAKKWLDVNKMNILLVGDKAKILPGLQKMGYEIVELDVDGNKK